MEWISVKDRLPDNNDEVLMFICGVHVLGYVDINGEWYNDVDEKEFSGSVTHWMPLPDPPKEKIL